MEPTGTDACPFILAIAAARLHSDFGGSTCMPRLSLFQLMKVFAAGFLGYAVLIALSSVGITLLFPSYVKDRFDMSTDTFLEMAFIYLGFLGAIASFLMFIGAWLVLQLFRRGV